MSIYFVGKKSGNFFSIFIAGVYLKVTLDSCWMAHTYLNSITTGYNIKIFGNTLSDNNIFTIFQY